jgi:hypothetical protein
VQWNQQGAAGAARAAGPGRATGTARARRAIATLDSLEGIPCTGVNGKIATVHLSYGTGIYGFLLGILAGDDTVTLNAAAVPVITAP